MSITDSIFYFFIGCTVLSGVLTVLQNHPVRSVLFLVLTFFGSASLWLMLQAEFLSLILLLVYVGAVMTLFLFVVMMLQVDVEAMRDHVKRLLPLGLAMVCELVGLLAWVFSRSTSLDTPLDATTNALSNTAQIGRVLYTEYLYPFELAAVILLIAMVAAITLVHRQRTGTKRQNIRDQIMTDASQRIRLVPGARRVVGGES